MHDSRLQNRREFRYNFRKALQPAVLNSEGGKSGIKINSRIFMRNEEEKKWTIR